MAADESVDDGAQQPPQKRRRGDKKLPRGVSGPNKSNKYVARASFKPDPESKAVQRNLGSFDSIEEAAAAVSTAEAELAAGGVPWDKGARVNQYKRGEVRVLCATRSLRDACARLSLRDASASHSLTSCPLQKPMPEKKERQPRIWNLKPHLKQHDKNERDSTLPMSVPMPSAVEDITDAGMRAMWEQSVAMDGEVAPCVEPLD